MATDRYELFKQMILDGSKTKEQKKKEKDDERYEQFKVAVGYKSPAPSPSQQTYKKPAQTVQQVEGILAGKTSDYRSKHVQAMAKEEESRRVKQEEKQSWNDYVKRLTDQYMPVRPDPIPQVDINKKYGPSSSRSAVVASAGVSDAPFNSMSEAERDRREREERDRADREAYQAALERANLGRGGKLNESSGRGGDLNLPSTGRGGAIENNPANGWDYDARKAQDIRRVEQEDELANKYQLQPTAPRQYTENETVIAADQAKRSITELTAERDRLRKDIETYDTVLKWPVGRQDVEGQQNFANAQAQRPQAQ
ncbi:MAG: hypothetical protein EOM66_10790, partial [Clostridia bacterium]|nr:hypothetical protein [Clostridia bacterium]